MAYGDDITERLPYVLSNPSGNTNYSATGYAYDIAIAGLPFFISPLDDSPYRRVTAQYRKQQVDQTREPGEQTLTGWWLRSQSSFHYGQGIKFFEPTQDESLRFQYTRSKGIDVWTKGQATLLKDVDNGIHTTTGGLQANGRPNQMMRSIKWDKLAYTGATTNNTYNGVLLLDEYDVDKIVPRITVAITNKALTTNVATLTTSAAHGLAIGMQINVLGVDATFNGEYRITSVPTATTFTYAKTATNVTSTAVSPPGAAYAEVTHFIDYNAGVDEPVYAICDDGTYAYWVTNKVAGGANKMNVFKKLLTDDSTGSDTLMFAATGILVTNAVIEFTKGRLVLAVNNQVYEFATSATVLPTSPVYTYSTNNFVYTSITSSGTSIYLSGYTNIQSTIQKFTLGTDGAMPVLTSAITAAELPVGEIVYKISYYLGYMSIGTSLGMRVAAVSDADGSINYGPLLFESDQPVYDFAFRDKYIWAATGVDGQVGVTRINLGTEISSLVFAYAWDLYNPDDTLGHYTTACAFLGNSNRLAFCNAGDGLNGAVYIEAENTLIAQGSLQTGFIRYNTLETKIFKLIQPRIDTTDGAFYMESVTADGTAYNIGSFAEGDSVGEVNVNYPTGSQQYLGFRFTMYRSTDQKSYTATVAGASGGYTVGIAATTAISEGQSITGTNIAAGTKILNISTTGGTTTLIVDTAFTGALGVGATFNIVDTTIGPLFTGYQVKALPAIPRQRLIQYPVMCYDHEMDKLNNAVGYEGSAWARMSQLEAVENIGDTIKIEDYRTDESYIGLIEEIDFINKTPSDKRFSGFGGLLLVTIRSV
jgi:hypothetical protein